MPYNANSPPLTAMDVINLAAFINLPKALDLKVLEVAPHRSFSPAGITYDAYAVGPLTIYRSWQDMGLYDVAPQRSPGYWADANSGCVGYDIISLKLYLAGIMHRDHGRLQTGRTAEFLREAAAQYLPDASKKTIAADLAKRLGIDLYEPSIEQRAAFRGWSQVAWASDSSPRLGQNENDDGIGPWPKYRPDRVPFLGAPHRAFQILDANGRLQQVIGEWRTAWGKPLLLSFTLWKNDKDPLRQMWRLARSAIKTCPYGLSWALQHPDATVVIDDDLSILDNENALLIKHHGPKPPIIFDAWPRGLSGMTPAHTDWTALQGRKIEIAVEDDQASFTKAFELHDELQAAGVGSTEFVLPKGLSGPKTLASTVNGSTDKVSVDVRGGVLRGIRADISEFSNIFEQRFGFPRKAGRQDDTSKVWRIGDNLIQKQANLILGPWLESRTVNLIYSAAGSGKSWFVLHVLYKLATGGALWGRFHAPKKLRCLYLAGETPGKMCQRLSDIHAAMNGAGTDVGIVVYPRLREKSEKLNLEHQESWDRIKEFTDNADVIAIDHLSAFTSSHHNVDAWSRLHAHLRQLTLQGKTILLIHHAGKNGEQLGTVMRDADIDTKVRIKRKQGVKNASIIEFEKHRDDETLGKALQPFTLYYERLPNDLLHWWTKDMEPSESQTWVSHADANVSNARSVNEAFIEANFEGREAEIICCLATEILKGKSGLKRVEIDRHLGVSEETTRSVFRSLVTKCSVIVEGNGKATRYALSEEIRKSIIQ